MPADAGFDLAIGNEYYAGGWVGCSVSFRAKRQANRRNRMRMSLRRRGNCRGHAAMPVVRGVEPTAASSSLIALLAGSAEPAEADRCRYGRSVMTDR
jgi:hypothetical protein